MSEHAPSPEENDQLSEHNAGDQELLSPLTDRFHNSLEEIRENREAIAVMLMGEAGYDRAAEKLHFDNEVTGAMDDDPGLALAYEEGASGGHSVDLDGELVNSDPDIGRLERINIGLKDLEQASLGDYSLPFDAPLVSGPHEEYTDARGDKRIRYTEYMVADDAVRAYEHDFARGDLHAERQKRIQEEVAAGVNGLPADPERVAEITEMLEQYQMALVALRAEQKEGALKYLGMEDAK